MSNEGKAWVCFCKGIFRHMRGGDFRCDECRVWAHWTELPFLAKCRTWMTTPVLFVKEF